MSHEEKEFEYPEFIKTNRNAWIVDRWYQKVAYVIGWIQVGFAVIYLTVATIALIAIAAAQSVQQ